MSDDDTDTLPDFIHEVQKAILESRVEEVNALNSKAANLIRLLGGIFTLYSGAVLLGFRLNINPDAELTVRVFLNEYTVASLLFLASAFLFAVLAYHRTTISKGPSARFLHNKLNEDDATVESVQREISDKVTGWVKNNDDEIERDHTRLFNCTMCIFFSLTFLIGGTFFAQELADFNFAVRGLLLAVIGVGTYVVYDVIRFAAQRDA